MASKAQMTLANHLLNIIKKAGTINKFELMDQAGISVATYNQISAWFQHRFVNEVHQVEYDKRTKDWRWCEIVKVQ